MEGMLAGSLYAPVEMIACAPPWARGTRLPAMTPGDWRAAEFLRSADPAGPDAGAEANTARASCLKAVRSLSWMDFARECVWNQARSFLEATDGVPDARMLVLSNAAFGNSSLASCRHDRLVYWTMLELAQSLVKSGGPDFQYGIRIHGGYGDWSVDIGCRAGMQAVFSDGWVRDPGSALACRSRRMSSLKRDWPRIHGVCDNLPEFMQRRAGGTCAEAVALASDAWDGACFDCGIYQTHEMLASLDSARKIRPDFGWSCWMDRRDPRDASAALRLSCTAVLGRGWHRGGDPLEGYDPADFGWISGGKDDGQGISG